MIRLSIVTTVWRKELLETVRDRRSLAIMLLLPIVLYPGLMVGTSQMFGHHMARVLAERGHVLVVGPVPERVLTRIAEDDHLTVVADWPAGLPVKTVEEELDAQVVEARSRLQSSGVDAVLVVAAAFAEQLSGNGTAQAIVFFDNTDDGSQVVANRLVDVLNAVKKGVLAEGSCPESY